MSRLSIIELSVMSTDEAQQVNIGESLVLRDLPGEKDERGYTLGKKYVVHGTYSKEESLGFIIKDDHGEERRLHYYWLSRRTSS